MEGVKRPYSSKMKRGSSLSHFSEMLAHISPASNGHLAVGCGSLFRTNYLSTSGKWLHLSKLLTVVFIPILGGWAFTLYSLADNVIQKDSTVQAQNMMLRAINLGNLIYTIQSERDMAILYVSSIGPSTKTFLLEKYDETDKSIEAMWNWPEEFSSHPNESFRSKSKLTSYIRQHRAKLEPATSDLLGEIDFYSDIVNFFMSWMIERIRESGFGNTWKSLVVFQKITRCLLDAGAERAYGAMFFAQGNFANNDLYDNYFRRIFRFNYNYRSSSFYSDLIDPLTEVNADYSGSIRKLREDIKHSNFTGDYRSEAKAKDYFDNATSRVDYLFRLQEQVAARVIRRINSTIKGFVDSIITYSVTASLVVMACPVIMFFTEAQTSNMQAYSKVLVRASDELNQEKNKTNSLIYQMLPKQIAERLKRKKTVESEYFKSATIMFTSIVNFTQMSIEYSAMELIEILNDLYSFIDDTITKYDVYKVETINDTYMVVSGVPVLNGSRHASELAKLALDIIYVMKQKSMTTRKLNIPIRLLVGINTGPVSAGVVGTVTLRYCLFGDTVNTASRMMSYSQPNRIHISESTFRNLKKTGHFKMQSRGFVSIKGKGEMNTFWLVDALQGSNMGTADGNLPGEAIYTRGCDSVSSVASDYSTRNEETPKFTKSRGGHLRKQSKQYVRNQTPYAQSMDGNIAVD